MLRETSVGTEYFLTIISRARPDRVAPMSKMVGAATWIVTPEDYWQYKEAGAGAVEMTKGLSEARNLALELAFKQGYPCVQLDDDLKGAKFAYEGKGAPTEPYMAVEYLVERCLQTDLPLAGGQPTNNPYFARGGTKLFILGSAICVKPSSPRFDTRLWLKEDYDFTCQHIDVYGGALRIENLIFDFAHYTNKGGAVDSRSDKIEQRMIEYLMQKWPGWIHKHPTRQNEVLLRLPNSRRAILT